MRDKDNNKLTSSGEDAIEEICISTWKELYRFIYYRVQNREEAEDITQETYTKMLSYLKQNHKITSDYSSFLKKVALNIIRDRWRLKKRAGKSVNLDDVLQEEIMTEDFAEQANNRAYVESALEYLTEEQRTVIRLRIINGYSTAQTAKIMKKKDGTVRVMLYRALKALTDILNESNSKGGI